MGHCTAYSVVLERLAGVSVPLRAQLLRRMGLEFERLANHTGDLGAIAGDTGFLPTSSWNGRIRGDFLNMTAEICGNRFGRGLVCPGGVNWDLDPAACRGLLDRLRAGWRDVKGAVDVMFASPSVLDRLTGTGCVSLRTAEDFGMVGVAQVEGWRGELCHVAVTDAEGRFGVYKIYDPSWHNWSGLEMALRGEQISDFPLCNKSFNLSYCGHDL